MKRERDKPMMGFLGTTQPAPKKPKGRPAKDMPPRIPDTPENIARAIMKGPPKKSWRYLDKNKAK